MSMYAKVRRMHFREKKPISEIARLTSLSRNTIKKWFKEQERDELKYVCKPGATKLDPYCRGAAPGVGDGCPSAQAGSAHVAGTVSPASSRPRAIPVAILD